MTTARAGGQNPYKFIYPGVQVSDDGNAGQLLCGPTSASVSLGGLCRLCVAQAGGSLPRVRHVVSQALSEYRTSVSLPSNVNVLCFWGTTMSFGLLQRLKLMLYRIAGPHKIC